MPRPHNVSAVKRFLGMVGYFRDYIRNMSMRTKFLRSLLQKGVLFVWTSNHEAEFQDLKTALVSPDLMLYHPDFDKPFEVHTDASKYSTGAMLAQWHDNELRPVRYASRAFTQTESNWPTAHQELFAVKWTMEHFRPYILGHPVKVITDHANLKWLTSIKPQQPKLARWCLSLAEFGFTTEHCPGRVNVVPDTLSRAPVPSSDPQCAPPVIPPHEAGTFLVSVIGFDIPFLISLPVYTLFSHTSDSISLVCTIPPSHSPSDPSHSHLPSIPQIIHVPGSVPSPIVPLTHDFSDKQPSSIKSDQSTHEVLAKPTDWCHTFSNLCLLNLSRSSLALAQQQDKFLGSLYQYVASNFDNSVLKDLSKKERKKLGYKYCTSLHSCGWFANVLCHMSS